jgi:uncharacterized Zn finger protein
VLNIDFEGTAVKSRVQGSRSEPYTVSIHISSINDKQWEKVIDVMAGQAIYAAKLLAGEMPKDIEEAFSTARVALFPEQRADLRTECSCPDYANPCKHISAVYYLLGERFDADPFLLFQLRGRSKDEIIGELRTRRGIEEAEEPVGAGAADNGAQMAGVETRSVPVGQAEGAGFEAGRDFEVGRDLEALFEAGPPLEHCVGRFWALDPEIESMEFTIARPAVEAAVVKRLGQPAFWKSELDFMSEMESIYRSISEAAIKTALGD